MRTVFGAALLASVVAGSLVFSAVPASAVTGTCQDSKFLISLSDVAANNSGNVFCGGQPMYNDPDKDGLVEATFFGMEYVLSFKSDEAGKGDGKVTFTDFPTDGSKSDLSWAISDLAGIASEAIIGFKQSTLYAAFLLSSTSGTWSITKLHSNPAKNKVENDYSHVDIWYKPTDGTIEVIPLPASLPLLLGGLAGLGIFSRRRRAA